MQNRTQTADTDAEAEVRGGGREGGEGGEGIILTRRVPFSSVQFSSVQVSSGQFRLGGGPALSLPDPEGGRECGCLPAQLGEVQ